MTPHRSPLPYLFRRVLFLYFPKKMHSPASKRLIARGFSPPAFVPHLFPTAGLTGSPVAMVHQLCWLFHLFQFLDYAKLRGACFKRRLAVRIITAGGTKAGVASVSAGTRYEDVTAVYH